MTTTQDFINEVLADADAAAGLLLAADKQASLALVQAIERRLTGEPLNRLERVWDLSASQAAALFGVSRQAYAKWRTSGLPAGRHLDVADMDSATSILLAYVNVDRIPAVVRRPADSLGGESLLAMAGRHPSKAYNAVVEMFDLRRVQP
jgi:hypothetical protein